MRELLSFSLFCLRCVIAFSYYCLLGKLLHLVRKSFRANSFLSKYQIGNLRPLVLIAFDAAGGLQPLSRLGWS